MNGQRCRREAADAEREKLGLGKFGLDLTQIRVRRF
jgi:hypothetical protein